MTTTTNLFPECTTIADLDSGAAWIDLDKYGSPLPTCIPTEWPLDDRILEWALGRLPTLQELALYHVAWLQDRGMIVFDFPQSPIVTPIPASALMLATGIAALAFMKWSKK